MATDATTTFPGYDPLDDLTIDTSSLFDENPTLGPFELPLDYPGPGHQPGHELHDILDSDDPLSDPFIWAFCNETDNNDGAGPSQFHGESSSDGVNGNSFSMPLPVFGVTQSQYNCTFCQTLREITHTNGSDKIKCGLQFSQESNCMNVKRLEIHGRLGIITHAVLGRYDFDSSIQSHEFQMFDFHKESTQIVKKFLIQYYESCKQEGYNTVQDPLSTFYEAVCVGLNEPDNTNDFLQLSPENIDDCLNNREETLNQPEDGSNQGGSMKISLAMQRERTRKLKLKDFKGYFHLPIEDAARKMNICPTVMKKICRRNGVLRWPYRKIKSIQSKIRKKMKIVESGDNEALEDIQRHKQELANIYEAFSR
ncbi:hypothetical protein BUALT_Bualt01G0180000 [Buddleja alternifolia]|uniref:RWP-RK domain-containing protein n=1 Tax=Buddleja alternifolia TaxID=168488 RepID=A0AAV6YAF2_9LAMI|nr:hypothetical protein BUALT_Bualt01G0180000 [Buddleja alternifolia]